DEDEESGEEEFKEEEDPQEEEDDMEVDIKEDENEPELTYPYEEVDPLNPMLLTSESEPANVIEVENTIEHEDETVPARVHEVSESSTAAIPRKDAKDEYYGKLIMDLGNEVRSSVEEGAAAMEKLVEKLDNAEDKAECKKLNKELKETSVIPPDHVDDLPDPALVIPEPILVDEDEDPEEEEFEKEEGPQEEEDMDIDDEEDENESELTFPYEEANPLNPPPHAPDLEPEDVIEVEETTESEDETVPDSVHEDGLCISREEKKAKDKYYGKLILDLGNEVRSSVEEGAAAMENLVRKLGNAEEIAECKKLKKELEEARPNEAIDVPVEYEESPSFDPLGSFYDS
nr:hypothetical protein [Tanacetum cinerariifolium]